MAFESDEMNKRRQLRDEVRHKRLAQQKKLQQQLLIAAVVLLVCGIVIFAVSRSASQNNSAAVNAGEAAAAATAATVATARPTEETEPAPTSRPATSVVRLAAAGDLNVNDAVVNSGGVLRDFSHVFMDVVPLLSEADLTVLNFEGNAVGQPYGSEYVSAPPELLETLVRSGVDMVQMANSKSISNGVSGLATTLSAVRYAGLEPLGAYATVEEAKRAGGYTIKEVNGIRIAFVAFTKGMDSMALPEGSERCINLLYTDYATTYNTVNTEGIEDVLKAVRQERPDITVAMLHWGSEYNDMISDTQEEIIDLMYEEGVDAIIGTHPHYVQSIEFDEEEGTFLCYSLGDFISDTSRAGTEYSIILELEITKDNDTEETRITGYSYTPIFTVAENDTLKVVRLEEAIITYDQNNIDAVNDDTYSSLLYARDRVAARVASSVETEE